MIKRKILQVYCMYKYVSKMKYNTQQFVDGNDRRQRYKNNHMYLL